MIKNFKWLLLVAITITACSKSEDTVDTNSSDGLPLTSGSADFSKYVALGDSFAAGYSDGALFIESQKGAYPNILAQQFALVGGGDFKTPFMADNIGGLLLGGFQIQGPRLYFNGSGPVPVAGPPTTEIANHLAGSFNNMGIPGAKSFHLLASGYGNIAGVVSGQANPYYARFASSASASIIDDAINQTPSFFSLWIGGNDVLSYAISGGTGTNQTGNLNPATYGPNDITDPNVFASVYNTLITKLTANGAKGLVVNVPYITSIPYFTTVQHNVVPLDAATSTQLNGATGYGAYNAGIVQAFAYLVSNNLMTQANADAEIAKRTINFHAGSDNAVVIMDKDLTDLTTINSALISMRQATSEDFIVLPASSFIGTKVGGNPLYVNGVTVPLEDKWVLSKNEASQVKTATDAYNVTIQSLSVSKGLAFVDSKAILNQVANGGYIANGFTMTSAYVKGNSFSLDGIHASPRGYALIANECLKAINLAYGSNLKVVDLGKYRTLFPQNPANF